MAGSDWLILVAATVVSGLLLGAGLIVV